MLTVDVRLICKDILYYKILYVTERQTRSSLEPDCCGCLLLKWMQNWFHASIHCSTPWTDRWWHWLWFVLKEITLISAALSPNSQCAVCMCTCQSRFICTYVCLDGCISTQVSQNLSLCRQISQRFEKMSLLLHQINLFARGIHGNWKRFEVSRKFRRDGKKDFVLPRKYSFHQLKMTERISEWLRSRVPHEQPRLRPFRHTPLWHSCS